MRTQSVFFPNYFLGSVLDSPTWETDSHVEENENAYLVQIDAPGMKREEIKISTENRHLVIEGERKGRGKFRKVFTLPDDVETAAIAARLDSGVLELALPKKEQAKPKSIEIQEGGESFFQKLLGKSA